MSISRRTIGFVFGGFALALGSYAFASVPVLGPSAQLALVSLAEPVVLGLCAFAVLRTALRFGPGEPLRGQWLPIGVGLLLFALGDLAYAYYEIVLASTPPSPGLPDFMYALFYPLVAIGILRAAWGYRRLVPLRGPMLLAGAAALGLLAVVWIPFARLATSASVADGGASFLELLYPAADVVFVVAPALLMLLIALKMRGARLAAPWIAVALGGAVFAAADVWFLYLQWTGAYQGGNLTDAGWMIGGVLIATGALLSADVNLARVPSSARRSGAALSTPAAPTP